MKIWKHIGLGKPRLSDDHLGVGKTRLANQADAGGLNSASPGRSRHVQRPVLRFEWANYVLQDWVAPQGRTVPLGWRAPGWKNLGVALSDDHLGVGKSCLANQADAGGLNSASPGRSRHVQRAVLRFEWANYVLQD